MCFARRRLRYCGADRRSAVAAQSSAPTAALVPLRPPLRSPEGRSVCLRGWSSGLTQAAAQPRRTTALGYPWIDSSLSYQTGSRATGLAPATVRRNLTALGDLTAQTKGMPIACDQCRSQGTRYVGEADAPKGQSSSRLSVNGGYN